MDEPGDNEFSSSIVFGFFDQAEETFASMDTALYVTPTTPRCAASENPVHVSVSGFIYLPFSPIRQPLILSPFTYIHTTALRHHLYLVFLSPTNAYPFPLM
jgi:hypothetical protein